MAAMEEIDTIDLPVWAICALEYGDMSGLSEQDCEQVESFCKRVSKGFQFVTYEYPEAHNPYFSTVPEFGLPTNCVMTTIWGKRA